MTKLMHRAIAEVAKLPTNIQDEVAQRLLRDLEGERKWDTTLARSQDVLERLADEALEEFHAGTTVEMGFDEL